jgi:hypothetical protein
VNTKVLTIYEEPNPYAREVGYVKEGETVRLTSRTFGRQIIDYQQSYWYGVKTNNNKTGWVYGYHLGGDKNKMDGLPVDWNAVFFVRPREKMNNSYGEEVISPIFPGTGLILEDTPLKIDPAIQSNTLVTLSKYSKVRYIVDSEEKEKKGFPDWVKVEEMKEGNTGYIPFDTSLPFPISVGVREEYIKENDNFSTYTSPGLSSNIESSMVPHDGFRVFLNDVTKEKSDDSTVWCFLDGL